MERLLQPQHVGLAQDTGFAANAVGKSYALFASVIRNCRSQSPPEQQQSLATSTVTAQASDFHLHTSEPL